VLSLLLLSLLSLLPPKSESMIPPPLPPALLVS
jgi:hypothetical protein